MSPDEPFGPYTGDDDDPPTEADLPVVDGAWDDNPFASAMGGQPEEATRVEMSAFEPDAAPASAHVSGLRMPPDGRAQQQAPAATHGSGLIQAQAPAITHSSGLIHQQAHAATHNSGLIHQQAHVQPQQPPPTYSSGLIHPPRPVAPQVPLPDPRQVAMSAPKLPAPPGYGQGRSEPTSSISYTIDFILDALEPAKKRKRWVLLAIVLLAAGGVAAWYFVGSSSVGDKIEADTPAEAEVEVAAPTWQELELASTRLSTTPEGARVIVNGKVHEGTTPLDVELIAGQPNTIVAYLDGHFPAWSQVDKDFDPAAGLELALTPVEASPLGYIKVGVADEDNGARVFIDGKDMGTAPVLAEELPLGVVHHVQVEREGKGSWVRIWRTTERREELTAPPLPSGVYTDRNTEVVISVAPPQAKLMVDGALPDNSRLVRSWGERLALTAEMPGRVDWLQNLHTTGIGAFRVEADLPVERLGQARVRWRVEDDDLKTCLVRPGRGFCWREDASNYLVVDEGDWTVRVYEEQRDGTRKYFDDEPTITFAANQEYKVKVDIDDGRVELDAGRPRDWDGSEDGDD